jgi:hypothetical protein
LSKKKEKYFRSNLGGNNECEKVSSVGGSTHVSVSFKKMLMMIYLKIKFLEISNNI